MDLSRQTTLAQQMAMAIFRDDMLAAYALAEMLLEERDRSLSDQAKAAKELREQTQIAHDGWSVYRWPEFQAFCKRAGFLWDLRTIGMVITINEGEMLKIEHTYAGSDDQRQDPGSVETTTLQNNRMRTCRPTNREQS